MNSRHKSLHFPLIVAGYSASLVERYDNIVRRLQALEEKLKQKNSDLNIADMWSVNCSRGRMIFHVTAQCADRWVRAELLSIFEMTDRRDIANPPYTWQKAPKLNASSVLSVTD